MTISAKRFQKSPAKYPAFSCHYLLSMLCVPAPCGERVVAVLVHVAYRWKDSLHHKLRNLCGVPPPHSAAHTALLMQVEDMIDLLYGYVPALFIIGCQVRHCSGGGGKVQMNYPKNAVQKNAKKCKYVQKSAKKCNHKNAMTRQHNTQHCTTQCAPNETLNSALGFGITPL